MAGVDIVIEEKKEDSVDRQKVIAIYSNTYNSN